MPLPSVPTRNYHQQQEDPPSTPLPPVPSAGRLNCSKSYTASSGPALPPRPDNLQTQNAPTAVLSPSHANPTTVLSPRHSGPDKDKETGAVGGRRGSVLANGLSEIKKRSKSLFRASFSSSSSASEKDFPDANETPTAPAVPSQEAHNLDDHPENWTTVKDEASGDDYYWNLRTCKPTWDRPGCLCWHERVDARTGEVAYWNSATGQFQGARPLSIWKSDRKRRDTIRELDHKSRRKVRVNIPEGYGFNIAFVTLWCDARMTLRELTQDVVSKLQDRQPRAFAMMHNLHSDENNAATDAADAYCLHESQLGHPGNPNALVLLLAAADIEVLCTLWLYPKPRNRKT